MGAEVADWRPSAIAQLAAEMNCTVEYAQVLLDLVKAFDRLPHWLLLREAIALGYPLRLLRLSLEVYKLKRVIRIGGVVSKCLVAIRGITAGSGLATTEMRLVLVRAVDRQLNLHPQVNPTLVVDDLAADMIAPGKHIVKELGGFHTMHCRLQRTDSAGVVGYQIRLHSVDEAAGRRFGEKAAGMEHPVQTPG